VPSHPQVKQYRRSFGLRSPAWAALQEQVVRIPLQQFH
jgi:hypothetical protein